MAVNLEQVDENILQFQENMNKLIDLVQKVQSLSGSIDESSKTISQINSRIDEIKQTVEKDLNMARTDIVTKNEKYTTEMVNTVQKLQDMLKNFEDDTIVSFENNIKMLITKSFEANKKILEALNERVSTVVTELDKAVSKINKENVVKLDKVYKGSRSMKILQILNFLVMVTLIVVIYKK